MIHAKSSALQFRLASGSARGRLAAAAAERAGNQATELQETVRLDPTNLDARLEYGQFLLFDAGPYGLGHQHEDKLSMFIYALGRVLLTEAGTYSYDRSKYRRYVLGTWAHNTILVDGGQASLSDYAGKVVVL